MPKKKSSFYQEVGRKRTTYGDLADERAGRAHQQPSRRRAPLREGEAAPPGAATATLKVTAREARVLLDALSLRQDRLGKIILETERIFTHSGMNVREITGGLRAADRETYDVWGKVDLATREILEREDAERAP